MKSTQPSAVMERALDAARDNPRASASIAAVAGVGMIYVLFFVKHKVRRRANASSQGARMNAMSKGRGAHDISVVPLGQVHCVVAKVSLSVYSG